MKTPTKTETKEAPKPAMPKMGDIVIVNLAEGPAPMIVTTVRDSDFDGQAFLHGTQSHFAQNVTYGDGIGQSPLNTNPTKEA